MDEENKVGTDVTTPEATSDVAKKQTLDELLANNKEYQSEYDKKVAQAMNTRLDNERKKWEQEQQTKIAEAEKLAKMNESEKVKYEKEQLEKELAEYKSKENARTLKDEAIKMATEKEIPIAYLDLFNFGNMTAEEVKTSIERIEAQRNKDRESYLNSAFKQKTPTQKQTTSVEEEDPYLKGFDSYK